MGKNKRVCGGGVSWYPKNITAGVGGNNNKKEAHSLRLRHRQPALCIELQQNNQLHRRRPQPQFPRPVQLGATAFAVPVAVVVFRFSIIICLWVLPCSSPPIIPSLGSCCTRCKFPCAKPSSCNGGEPCRRCNACYNLHVVEWN